MSPPVPSSFPARGGIASSMSLCKGDGLPTHRWFWQHFLVFSVSCSYASNVSGCLRFLPANDVQGHTNHKSSTLKSG